VFASRSSLLTVFRENGAKRTKKHKDLVEHVKKQKISHQAAVMKNQKNIAKALKKMSKQDHRRERMMVRSNTI
jgi:hypothetical protein